MSDIAANWGLPSLELYPERPDSRDRWQDTLEAVLTSLPMAMRSRFGHPQATRFVRMVNRKEAACQAMDNEALLAKTGEIRSSLRRHGFRDAVVAEAFALVRETAHREIGLRHYDVQLRGGYAMLRGMIAEMDTGEGKTLAATLAAATAALAGYPVHVVTVNDYLAQRDAAQMEPLYHKLGLSTGTIIHGLQPHERRAAYGCEITYASNKEITFDYLRDRIALGSHSGNLSLKLARLQGKDISDRQVVMRGLHFAIVDEADSVLVDEARTPLIISRQTDASNEQRWADDTFRLIEGLEEDRDYTIQKEERRIELTEAGREHLSGVGEEFGGIWRSSIRREESARQALAAVHLFKNGDHYLVRDGKVQIIDEYTGRIMADRSWSEGLHQLVETKEGCEVTSRKVPVARMTYQRFFRRYRQLAGMTGTAHEVAGELWSVYRLPVVRIPPNRPKCTQRFPAQVCRTADEKWEAIVSQTTALSQQGRPVLIGTRSVKASETISEQLTEAGLDHVVLSAAQDENEAQVIADAGKHARITVATNMAGRGVDIRLGNGIRELGGLHVILSERHDARRIDRQLEGRCGRQGDPGSTAAILSLEDPLLELVDNRVIRALTRLTGPFEYKGRLLLFRRAQRRAERSHSRVRRKIMKLDRKLGVLLAFSGGME
ncbi:MAG: preprotein translocase subunit SecA [Pseudomonadota bacterium]